MCTCICTHKFQNNQEKKQLWRNPQTSHGTPGKIPGLSNSKIQGGWEEPPHPPFLFMLEVRILTFEHAQKDTMEDKSWLNISPAHCLSADHMFCLSPFRELGKSARWQAACKQQDSHARVTVGLRPACHIAIWCSPTFWTIQKSNTFKPVCFF